MFRLYNYREGNINFNEYYCNLTDIKNNEFKCKLSYNFVKEYKLKNIDLENMIDLYNKLNNNSYYLNKYKKNYSPPNIKNANYINEIIHNI
tara:strand:+ start:177 stop:449 length:273 start_codon:yes stop_codon:yes gene_type:complete